MDGVVSLCKPLQAFSFLEVRSRFARANLELARGEHERARGVELASSLELARGSGSLILQLISVPSSMNFFAVSLRYLLVRSLTPHDLLLEK